eukprot:COSAG02_NODE_52247_length_309_cov_0.619048_2_plen_30_part_01
MLCVKLLICYNTADGWRLLQRKLRLLYGVS